MNLNYYRHAERSGEPLVRETKHNMKELYPSTSRLTFVGRALRVTEVL